MGCPKFVELSQAGGDDVTRTAREKLTARDSNLTFANVFNMPGSPSTLENEKENLHTFFIFQYTYINITITPPQAYPHFL